MVEERQREEVGGKKEMEGGEKKGRKEGKGEESGCTLNATA